MRSPGQTVVVIGGSAGIGLETARLARAEGAEVILTGRDPERLEQAPRTSSARVAPRPSTPPIPTALAAFFDGLPAPIDHVMVTAGRPYYAPLAEMDFDAARRALRRAPAGSPCDVARHARGQGPARRHAAVHGRHRRPPPGRRPRRDRRRSPRRCPALVANLALELAPIRVNLIAAGFVDTPLSASLLGDELDARREQLRATLPIGRVVGPADVAALAVHLMTNTALTGATYDIDGGQQLVH